MAEWGLPRPDGSYAQTMRRESPSDGANRMARTIQRQLRRSAVPDGLCPQRGDHPDHEHTSESLGRFWCTGREADREPGRSERRRAAEGVVDGIRPHLPVTPEELAERERVMLSLPITPLDL